MPLLSIHYVLMHYISILFLLTLYLLIIITLLALFILNSFPAIEEWTRVDECPMCNLLITPPSFRSFYSENITSNYEIGQHPSKCCYEMLMPHFEPALLQQANRSSTFPFQKCSDSLYTCVAWSHKPF